MRDFLKQISLFKDLTEEDYLLLEKACKRKKLAAHKDVFKSGKDPKFLHLVEEGLVKLYNKSKASEKEEIVCVIQPQGFFCLSPVITQKENHINAKTLAASELITIPAKTIQKLIETSHIFSRRVIEFLANKESSLCKDICSLSLSNTKERLAKYILSEYDRNKQPKTFKLPLNQTQLASFLGTVREVVSRDFAGLKKTKIINMEKGKISVKKPEELEKIARGFCKR